MSFDLIEETPKSVGVLRGTPTARTAPHSLEAEEYLLSVCLLDGADVVPRCIDAKIMPSSFYLTAHGIVFDCIQSIYGRGLVADVLLVAEELKSTKQLASVGGFAFLTQISSRMPTTAQAGYYIQKVSELAALRQIIRQATRVVEESYEFTGGIEEFVTTTRDKLEHVLEGARPSSELLKSRAFDPLAPIVEARIVYRMAGTIVCTAGNLTQIVAGVKAGKSAVVDAMMAAAMTEDSEADCLTLTGHNAEGLPFLHFDTEQSKADYQRLLHRSLRRAGLKEFPAWFHSYHLTGLSAPEARQMVAVAMSHHARRAGGRLFAVILDGIADLVINPNDEDECFPYISHLHSCAIKFDTPIINILHYNPGSDKSRGHLGSQLERKAESIIMLEKDENDVTAVWAPRQRGATISKADGPRFAWSTDHAMHRTVGDWKEIAAQARAAKKAAKADKNPAAFAEKYSREEMVSFYPASTSPAEPIRVIQRRTGERVASAPSPRTMDRLRMQFLADGWIAEVNGQYRRTAEGDDWAKRKPSPTPKEEFPL